MMIFSKFLILQQLNTTTALCPVVLFYARCVCVCVHFVTATLAVTNFLNKCVAYNANIYQNRRFTDVRY